MRFGVDIDGVIANFDRQFVKAMELAPEPIGYADLQRARDTWDKKSIVGEDNWKWFWDWAVPNLRVFEFSPSYAKELEYLARLPGQVYLITSRPPGTKQQTYRWLGKHYVAVDGVLQVDYPSEKVEFINCLGIDHFVDDRPKTIQGLVGKTEAKLWLFDRPWNRDVVAVKGHQITRIKSLKELL